MILGVRPQAFQIEDVAECKSSSNDQKSKITPSTLGWSLEYLLFENLSSHCHFLWFLHGNYIKSIEHWRPDPGDPPKRGVQKYLPEWDPAGGTFALPLLGGVGGKLLKKHWFFFSFFDLWMVIQTLFQVEDNLKRYCFLNRRYSRSTAKHFSNRR